MADTIKSGSNSILYESLMKKEDTTKKDSSIYRTPLGSNSILESQLRKEDTTKKDFSIYRTPSDNNSKSEKRPRPTDPGTPSNSQDDKDVFKIPKLKNPAPTSSSQDDTIHFKIPKLKNQGAASNSPEGIDQYKIPKLKKSPDAASNSKNNTERIKRPKLKKNSDPVSDSKFDTDQLKRPKIKKSQAWTIFNDAGLPKELKEKFTPLKCNLCEAIMNSTLQAKMHYTGKTHEKKVNQFLLEWSIKTGNPIPDREKKEEEIDKEYLHCAKCDITFTSKMNARQHYMGKNHRRNIPKLKGPPTKSDSSGRFFIGQDFKVKSDPLNLFEDITTQNIDPLKSGCCTICDVTCSSRDQIVAHLNGTKHKKKAARAELMKNTINVGSEGSNSILESLMKKEDTTKKDFSIYRTPSALSEIHARGSE